MSQLNLVTDADILDLLRLRFGQLDVDMNVSMFIVEPGDSIADIEEKLGFPILTNLFDFHYSIQETDMTTPSDHEFQSSDPLVAVIFNSLDDNLKEVFLERASIIEFDSNLPRPHAECLALLCVLTRR
jgi:hypothetical protein